MLREAFHALVAAPGKSRPVRGDAGQVGYLLEGATAPALTEARRLRDTCLDGLERVVVALEEAMEGMSAKCTSEQFKLLEIMLTGRAAMAVAHELFPDGQAPSSKGTVVIATPEGDVHDLGKNLTRMILTSKGFRVVDCGKDCPVATMIRAVAQEGAFALLVSGLISSVIPTVRQLRGLLRDEGLEAVTLVAGGAALKQCSADALKVDHVASDAFDGVRYLEAIVSDRR